MRLKDLLELPNLILGFDDLAEEGTLLEASLDDVPIGLVELGDCPKDIVLHNVHQAVKLSEVVLHRCAS